MSPEEINKARLERRRLSTLKNQRKRRLRAKLERESGESLLKLIEVAKQKALIRAADLILAQERMEKAYKELERLVALLPTPEPKAEPRTRTRYDEAATQKLNDAVYEATGFRMPKDWVLPATSYSAKAAMEWLAENTKPKRDTLAQ